MHSDYGLSVLLPKPVFKHFYSCCNFFHQRNQINICRIIQVYTGRHCYEKVHQQSGLKVLPHLAKLICSHLSFCSTKGVFMAKNMPVFYSCFHVHYAETDEEKKCNNESCLNLWLEATVTTSGTRMKCHNSLKAATEEQMLNKHCWSVYVPHTSPVRYVPFK